MAGAGHSSSVPLPLLQPTGLSPQILYYEVIPRAKTTPRMVPPVMSLDSPQSQVGARVGM